MATYIRGVDGIIEEIRKERQSTERKRLAAENNRKGKRPTPHELRLEGAVNALVSLENFLTATYVTILDEKTYDSYMEGVHARSVPAFSPTGKRLTDNDN